MFQNYLKIALRHASRNRGYVVLNLIGLALGLGVSLMIGLWVYDEWRYDRFHQDGERIFQVMNNMGLNTSKVETWTGSPAPYYQIFAKDLPEVEASSAMFGDSRIIQTEEKQTQPSNGLIATPNFFGFFSFPLLKGAAKTVFSQPRHIAVSEPLAARLFGADWQQRDLIGQPVELQELGEFTLSGVFSKVPAQSSLQFDYVLSLEDYFALYPEARDQYGNFFYQTFLKLKPNTRAEEVQAKLAQVVYNNSEREFEERAIFLHPLEQLHLYSDFEDGRADGGRIEYVRIFSGAAIFLLLIACINYMNLATARSSRRSREIGIRKVVGASRRSVFQQFMTESLLTTAAGVAIAATLTQALLPSFNLITGKELTLSFQQPITWILLLGLTLFTGLLAGSYPALALSTFRLSHILKGEAVQGFSDLHLRRALVVLQLGLSVLLLAGAFVVRAQVHYIQDKDLGLDRHNVLLVQLTEGNLDRYPLLREEISKIPGVSQVSGADGSPLNVSSATGDPTWEGFDESKRNIFSVMNVDHDFLDIMRIQMAQGEPFNREMLTDTANLSYLINETAARAMGLDEPLGKKLSFWARQGRIVGVVRDFHIASLHQPIQSLILRLAPTFISTILVRPEPEKTAEVITSLELLLKKVSPEAPLNYEFLDQSYAAMYRAEQTTGRLANFFAGIAVIISCLGLLGLTAFSAARRTRELGIRKVLGARVADLVWLLNRELGLLLILAFLLATPLAWWLLQSWLEGFAFHVKLGWQPFALAGLLLVMVAALTVSYHSLKAAKGNPAKALKME